MKQEVKVLISKDPLLKFDREVTVTGFHWNPLSKQITVSVIINFLDETKLKITNKRISPYNEVLVADDTTYVDSNGNILPEDHLFEEKEEKISEYSFFISLAQGKIDMFELIEGSILNADARGRFNL